MKAILSGMLASSVFLTGCAGVGNMLGHGTEHFYEGEPLPMSQVSVIESNGESGWGMGAGINLIAIDGKDLSTFAQSKQALKPGKHTLEYECDRSDNIMDGKHVGHTSSEVELEKGVHYRLVGTRQALDKKDWYYSEKSFLGQKQRQLETSICKLNLVKHKTLTDEG
ncbi:hypothetical protein [Thalassolituus marinus]|uniref:DUF2846 domain-containing protein n=1 Tax=Thalassolituus marinus TaxID=671053 RepID=A0ABS7ZRP1_9GAMM|nr:hypothetical protein [Thalassolituus marinus]MCA6063773.1 hypothetical protein [Thalassolituus marinus]